MTSLLLDLRATLRSLGRSAGFTAAAVATLALAVAANATIFSHVRGMLLRPLPYPEPDRLVLVETVRGGERGKLSALEVRDLDREASTLAGIASFRPTQYTATSDGQPAVYIASMSTYRLFEVLGRSPALGTGWPASDDGTTQYKVVISDRLWRDRYGADPAIIGKSVMLDVYPYEVIGVAPPGFDFPAGMDLWRRAGAADFESRAIRSTGAVARLAKGATLRDAQAELDALAARYAEIDPETNRGVRYLATPLHEYWVGEIRPYLIGLAAAVGLVLLLAAVNVAHLALVRASARQRELAVRAALGGSHAAVLRGVVLEGMVIGLAAAALGLLLVPPAMASLDRLVPFDRPGWMTVAFDGTVFGFGVIVALGAALIAMTWPAWRIVRRDPFGTLRSSGKGGHEADPAPRRFRDALSVAQVAIATVLVFGALSVGSTMTRLRAVELGFDPDRVLALKIDPPWTSYNTVANTAPFYQRVLEDIRGLPGVVAAASNVTMPYATQNPAEGLHRQVPRLDTQSPDEIAANPFVNLQVVSPGYFEAMRIPIDAGRSFTELDDETTTAAAIVSRSLARRLWPGSDPLGRRIAIGELDGNYRPAATSASPVVWYEVIGVAGDIRQAGLSNDPTLDFYLSHNQQLAPETYLVVRTRDDPRRHVDAVRAAVQRADPLQTVFDIRPLSERVERTYWRPRLAQVLLNVFALLTIVLAAVGVSGVVGFTVTRRLHELGIRLAVGASPVELRREVLWSAAKVGGAGAAIGLAVGITVMSAVRLRAPAVASAGAGVTAAVLLGALAVTVAAAWWPARRAARVEPLAVLRSE